MKTRYDVDAGHQHPQPGLYRIRTKQWLYLTGAQLKRLNAESIRLGFSRNLQGIDRIPNKMKLLVSEAFRHVSASDHPPLQNIRLILLLPTHIPANWRRKLKQISKSLDLHILDITNDAWQKVQRNKI